MYGTQDHLNKPSVSVTKQSIKCPSPAKRSKAEETRPVTADSRHTNPGQRHQGLPEMPPWQGPHPVKMTPKKPLGQGSYSIPKKPLRQGSRSTERTRKSDTRTPKPTAKSDTSAYTLPPLISAALPHPKSRHPPLPPPNHSKIQKSACKNFKKSPRSLELPTLYISQDICSRSGL